MRFGFLLVLLSGLGCQSQPVEPDPTAPHLLFMGWGEPTATPTIASGFLADRERLVTWPARFRIMNPLDWDLSYSTQDGRPYLFKHRYWINGKAKEKGTFAGCSQHQWEFTTIPAHGSLDFTMSILKSDPPTQIGLALKSFPGNKRGYTVWSPKFCYSDFTSR